MAVIWIPAAIVIVASCIGGEVWRRRGDYLSPWGLPYFFAAFAALSAVIIHVSVLIDQHGCHQKLDAMDRDGEYGIWTGCMVVTDSGDLVPLDRFRVNEDGEGDQ